MTPELSRRVALAVNRAQFLDRHLASRVIRETTRGSTFERLPHDVQDLIVAMESGKYSKPPEDAG